MYEGKKIRIGTLNIFNNIYYSIKEKLLNFGSEYIHNIPRKNLLFMHLFTNSFDIICLQEVDLFMINELKKKCLKYDFNIHISSENIKTSKNNNCIIYKKNYKLLDEKIFDLNSSVSKYFMNYSSESRCEIQDAFIRELKNRQSIANMVLLELSDRKTLLGICNCHIYWNPLYPDIKLYHTYLIIKEFYQFIQKKFNDFPFIPLILIGDFNSTPFIKKENDNSHLRNFSGVYELITMGRISKTHIEHPAQLRKDKVFCILPELTVEPFKSSFKEINGNEPIFTNKTSSFSGCIDFIFYKELIPLSAKTIPSNLNDIKMLPNEHFPSDHVLLVSEFFVV
ncbi:carbon catabolite repressor protein 4, putative [Plasmodium relictum]|uniref:Carbon catabolite repressor protein 4, putative n=1 Tax=Plasmodium relictum TaxID=85471 RepID=A0A1J1HC50_PLARL|nr:carbon catabolite repressor protein 4, putative [Plasmodium relictum]CRH03073.1 carbon catabolite repressor protein 4, putative [Plasmodium relictum]